MVKNVTVIDLALVELLKGRTDAPSSVLDQLAGKGYLTLSRGKATLTAKGRKRAEKLRPFEEDMRSMARAHTAGRSALTAVAGPTIHG
jgi:hypothetical protein